MKQTRLYSKHQQAGAKLVDFAGWEMPLHYGSQLEEHHQVRLDAGVFDVSHMAVIDIESPKAVEFLRYVLANDVAKLKHPGKALYTCMLNEQGGIIDDLIVYRLGENRYRLVVNAGTREKDWAWLLQKSQLFGVTPVMNSELVILAIQGPHAIQKITTLFNFSEAKRINNLRPFEVIELEDYCIARTGYTGEDGVEIIFPAQQAENFWDKLLAAEIKPCGLGARDTLRLEAGLNLYGSDMDETTSPLESNLSWTIAWEPSERDFIGRAALEAQKEHVTRRLVGLVLEQKGVLRHHQKVIIPEIGEGEITSGSFSPTLKQAIALARVPKNTGDHCFVEIRGQRVPARVVKPVFVRRGQKI